tara:strand:- start:6073 stop:6447 length:375 start_codon:yes stop_codon:yes gene_type:complete
MITAPPSAITLTFPWLFKSKANSYRIKRRKLVKDATVAAQEAAASATAITMMDGQPPWNGPIAVTVNISMNDNRRRDIDGCLKSLLDSLNGIVWKDDNQIVELHVYKAQGCPQPITMITISKLI